MARWEFKLPDIGEGVTEGEIVAWLVTLLVCVNGYLDGVSVADIGRYEQGLLGELRGSGGSILASVRDTGDLKPEVEKELRALIEAYTKSFG